MPKYIALIMLCTFLTGCAFIPTQTGDAMTGRHFGIEIGMPLDKASDLLKAQGWGGGETRCGQIPTIDPKCTKYGHQLMFERYTPEGVDGLDIYGDTTVEEIRWTLHVHPSDL